MIAEMEDPIYQTPEWQAAFSAMAKQIADKIDAELIAEYAKTYDKAKGGRK